MNGKSVAQDRTEVQRGGAAQGVDGDGGRWLTVPRTLAFVCHNDLVLLHRRRDDSPIHPGLYNGVGGHLERDEDPAGGVRREVEEETGLQVSQLRLRVICHVDPGGARGVLLFVFTCVSDSRDVKGAELENDLRWVPRRELATLPLVEDLPILLPGILDMPAEASPLYVHAGYDEQGALQLRIARETDDRGADR